MTLHRSDAGVSGLPGGRTLDDVADSYWQMSTDRPGWTQLEMTLAYIAADIAGLTESSLLVFRANAPEGPWTLLSGVTLDTSRNRLTFNTDQQGFFIIAE